MGSWCSVPLPVTPLAGRRHRLSRVTGLFVLRTASARVGVVPRYTVDTTLCNMVMLYLLIFAALCLLLEHHQDPPLGGPLHTPPPP